MADSTRLACSTDEMTSLEPNKIKELLDKDSRNEFLLLDVRQPEEYAAGHIAGAVLIPLGELESRHTELSRAKKIIVYCRTGRRTMAAGIVLCRLGFENLYHLKGGIENWAYNTVKEKPGRKPGLIPETSWPKDILVLAMKLEKGSAEFYLQAADKVQPPETKQLFRTLAAFEERHMQKVYEKAERTLGRGYLPPWEQLRRDLKVEYMEGGVEVSSRLAEINENFRDEMEALEMALEKEYLAYDFYQRASVLLPDADARILLHSLALEERGHADTVLNRLSNIVR